MKRKDLNNRYDIPYGKETQLLRDYTEKVGEYTIKIRIIKVPISEKNKIGLKYSLVLIRGGLRIVGFDNHEGKEPHVHIKDKEYKYVFLNEYKLMNDFYDEIERHVK